jgi:hypothetical protein
MKRLGCAIGRHRPLTYVYRLAGGGKARCRSCGRTGLVDSQGNLFAIQERR